ncbi:olfactory receptor 2S2 [Prionailurus iriomotensis]
MEKANWSSPVVGFILLGLSAHPRLEKTFFVLILSMYLVNPAGQWGPHPGDHP